MIPRVSELKLGRDVGAMINGSRLPQLERLVDDAVKQGARLLVGGKQFHHPEKPQGHYFEPTLLADVTMDMEIAKQECFAPIMLVLKSEVGRSVVVKRNAHILIIYGGPVRRRLHNDSQLIHLCE